MTFPGAAVSFHIVIFAVLFLSGTSGDYEKVGLFYYRYRYAIRACPCR